MKIFTLLQNLLQMITGRTSRNLAFSKRNAERVTPNAKRLTPNAKRETLNAKRETPAMQSVTLNAQRVTPESVLHSNEYAPQVNISSQNPMAPINNAFISVEYKILPVQKKITSVQNIKPVFMQNFFAIVKKIFSLSDRPETLLENLNDGYHPGCHYGTAGTENISLTNQHHDVANDAASFALIPIPLTPTAMNQSEKKPVKTITGRSGIFGIMMLMSSLFFVHIAYSQITQPAAWTNLFHSNSTAAQTPAFTVPAGSGTNRLLVVAIASSRTSTGAITIAPTYGTQPLTAVQGDMATTGIQQHTQLYILNEAGIEAATSTTLSFTVTSTGGGTIRGTDVWAAVFDGVDQTTPISPTPRTFSSGTGTTTSPTYNPTLLVNPGNQAVEVITSIRTGNNTPRTFSYAGTSWSSAATEQTFTTTDAVRSAVANRTVPTTAANEGNTVDFSGTALGSMTGMSIKAASPTITNLSASSGCTGTPLTITGTFLSGATVTIGGTPATVTNNTATSITVTIGAGTTGPVVVTNSAGTASTSPTNFTVNLSPTITPGGNAAICSGVTSANLNYTTTNSPDQYSIAWDAGATGAGFAPVTNALLTASPLVITVPGTLAAGTYTGTLTVNNSSTGCTSTGSNISIIVGVGGGWLGTTSTVWNDPSNWCGGVPTSATNVTIPAGTPFQPTISTNDAVCNDINISSGATLTFTGSNSSLTVSGNWTNAGTFVPGSSTIIFNSATTQTVNNGGSGDFFAASIGGAGTLQVLTNQFLTTNSFNIAAGGTLDLNGVTNPALGDLQGSGFITNSNATAVTLTEGSDNTSTAYSGIILAGTGAISLTKTGAGALSLSGTNAYTGTTTLTSGTLNINSSSAIGTSSLVINGGTIDNTSGNAVVLSTINPITYTASFTFGGTNNLNLGNGNITNSNTLTRIITLNGTNSILTFGGVMTNTSGANQTTTVNGPGNTFVVGGYTLSNNTQSRLGTFNGTGNVTLSGIVSNGGSATTSSITYSGTGALTLSGANSYGGTTTLTSGTLNINNATAIGGSSFALNGGTIDNTSGSNLTLTTNNPITIGGNFTFGGTNSLTFGTGAITNAGSRTITLNGAGTTLTFGGVMTNSAGTQLTTVNGVGNNIVFGGYTLTTSGTPRTVTFTGTGNVAITGPVINGGSGAGTLNYIGSGILTLSGTNTYTGGTNLSSGTLNINSAKALGSGTFTITGGTIDNTSGSANTLTNNNAQSWNGDFTFTGSNALDLGTGNVTISAVRQVTISANTLTDDGNFSGTGGITKLGAGTLALSGNTNNTGNTTITAGELRLNPSANSTSATPMILNGGVLGTTGIAASRTITSSATGTFTLAANSSINLDATVDHQLRFADSHLASWTSGATLTVFGWQGTPGSSGTAGKIFFGSSLGTLTPQQLLQIKFDQFDGIPIILAGTGEIVPQGAAPMLNITGALDNGNSCVGTSASTQTYFITNTASTNADGVTVVSDNPQFVVTNLSGTTAQANSVSPLSFQVTFTPTSSGSQTANITVSSTTLNSNSPVAILKGNGLANPVATFAYDAPSYCQALVTNPSPVPNPSPVFSGGGVAGTFSATPSGLVFVSATTGQVDLKLSAPGTYSVANFVTAANGCTVSFTAPPIVINALPVADISYQQSAFCKNDMSTRHVSINSATGVSGTFSVVPDIAGGLSLDAATGDIVPSTSGIGDYKVVFRYIGGDALCPNTDTALVTIAQTAAGTISYGSTPYCTNSGVISVTNNLTGTTSGGSFTAPVGLTIDPLTGAVTTSTSTHGTYTVVFNVPSIGGCDPFNTTADITIVDTPVATISYGGSNLCSNGGKTAPIIAGPSSGSFTSSPAGLSIDGSGNIDPVASTVGTYTVTYHTPAANGCVGSPNTTVTIQTATATPVLNTTSICTTTTSLNISLGENNTTPIQVRANGVTILTLSKTTSSTYNNLPTGIFHTGDIITLTAQATGKCLSSTSNSVIVGPPVQPVTITGNNTVCPGTTGNAYSVPVVPGVTYAWAYSGTGATFTGINTATPTISFSANATGGNLTVTPTNNCGTGTPQTLAISMNIGAPTSAGVINGPASACAGSSQTYSIASVINADTYTWSVPANWTINSGQGTTSINVTTGNTGDNGVVTVATSNGCGSSSQVVTTPATLPITGADVTGIGTVIWGTPTGITSVGGTTANMTVATSATTHYLRGTGYGFAIPAGATINGITVSINHLSSGTQSPFIQDNIVRLVRAGVIDGSNLAVTGTNWPTAAAATVNYGGPTNLWGTTWTPADINDPNFGVVLSAVNASAANTRNATVDFMEISVSYTLVLPVTVTAGPTITLGVNPSILCNGGTSANLTYSATTGSPDQYSITYNSTAIGAGFQNVATTLLPAGSIPLTIPAPLAGGTYSGTITVSSSAGCTGLPVPFSISVPNAITANASETDTHCFNGSDGTASVSPAGGNGVYTINWTGPNGFTGNGTNITGLKAGTYNYSITDGNGCGPVLGFVVVGQAAQLTATASETDASCFGTADGTATVTPLNGTAPYTITWTGPNGFTASGPSTGMVAAGTYTYLIVDAMGCGNISDNVIVNQPDEIIASASVTNACSDGTGGSVTINVSGGSGGEVFLIGFTGPDTGNPPINPNEATSILPGTYQYFVIDGACQTIVTFTVGQADPILVGNNGTKTDVTCNAGTNGSITLGEVSGGTPPYIYSWTTSDGTIPDDQKHVANPTSLSAGTYNFSVTDQNNCTSATATGSFIITQPTAVVVANNGSQTNVICNGGATGSITLGSVTGGSGIYTYSWTTSDGTIADDQKIVANPTGLTAGTYAYVVTDDKGCTAPTATGSFTITQSTAVVVANNGSQTNVTCNGGTNGSITLGSVTGGSGTYTYSWTTSDGTIADDQKIVVNPTGLTAGTYTYVVTDDKGCTGASATGSFTITQPTAVVVASGSQTNISCNGGATGAITLGSVTGGSGIYTYSWTTSDGTIADDQKIVANPTGLTAGTYTYVVIDDKGCTAPTATGSFTITQSTAVVVASNGSQTNVTCNGGTNGSITLGSVTGGSGTYTYSWTTSDGTIADDQKIVVNPTGLSAGTYTYVVSDDKGCTGASATGSFTITQPTAVFVANNGSQTNVICNGGATGSITLGSVTGGSGIYTYSWTTSDGTIADDQKIVANPTGLTAGTYTYVVTDDKGCTAPTATGSFTITQSTAVVVASNGSQTNVTCNGGTNGSITLGSVTGGSGTYTYSWTTSDGTIADDQKIVANPTGLTAGTYTYVVTDDKGCTGASATGSFTITQPTAVVVASGSQTNISCNGGATGAITLGSVTGGSGIYTYSWTTSDGTIADDQKHVANPTGLTIGTYTFVVTDDKGCTAPTATGSFTITQPTAIVVANDGSKTDANCNGDANGSITLGTVTGGTIPYTYAWSTSDGLIPASQQHVANPSGLKAGTYTFIVSDNHGCTGATATGSVKINQPDVLAATSITTNITCFGASNGMATITVTGGTPVYQYNIDGNGLIGGTNDNSKTFTGLAPGGHTVVITDNHGCTTSVTFTLTQPAQLAAIASAGTVSCSSSTTSLFVIASGGTSPYSYSLNGGTPQSGFVFTVGAGSYIVAVTDANSCTVNTASVSVANPSQMTIDITGVTPSGCSGATGSFNISASGGAGSYTYSLNGGGYQPSGSFTGLAANTYLVTAKDGNGCTVSGIVTINGGTPPTVYNVTGGGSSCSGSGFPVGLSNAQAGVTYFLLLNNTIIGSMPPANILPGFAFSFGNQTAPGVYTVKASNPATGCISDMSGSATIASGTPPTAFTLTGGGNYCNGAGPVIGLSGSQTGVSYQLVIDGTNTGAPINGNGSAISFGNQTTIGTYTVVATNATSCTNNMSNSVSITGGSLPTLFTVTADPDNCTGLGVHIRLAASQLNVTYQLILNGSIDGAVAPISGGNGTPIDFGLQPTGTYTVSATTTAGCTSNMTGSVTVVSSSLPIAYSVTGGGSYCSGGLGLHVGLQNSESGVNYQLFNGATAVSGFFPGSTGSQIDFGLFQAGTYTVVAKNATGCTNNMTGSVTVSLTAAPADVTLIAPNGVNDCTGTGADIQLSGSEIGVDYQLSVNGIAMGSLIPGTGGQVDLGKKPTGTYTIVGKSHTGGCVGNTSNNITINSGTAPIAYTVNGGGNYCSGPGLAIGLSNSETGVNYVLMLNGTTNVGFATGTNGNSLSFGNYTANGTYSVIATNTTTNCIANMLNSVSINAGTAPTAFNVTGGGSYCSGGIGVKVGLSSSESGINYQLMFNGSPSGAALVGNGSALDFGFQTEGTYTVVATNTQAGCTSNMNESAVITINGAAVIINTQPQSQQVCITSSIILSVSATNATGYQWFIGSSPIVGANSPTYSTGTSGSYTVVVSGICGAPVTSQPAVLTAAPVVAINTQPVGGAFCGSVQLSVGATGATGYQWFLGASSIGGANAATYTATAPGSYTVVVSGNCGAPVTSNPAVLTATPGVTITTQPLTQSFCGSVQLSVSATGATGYQWFLGASSIGGANAATYTATAPGSYTVVVSGNCGSPVTSNPAVLTASPGVTITTQPLTQSFCGSVQLSVSATGATGYQWFKGASSIGGANASTYTATASGSYTVVVSGNCGSPVTSNPAVLTTPAPVSITTQPQSQTFTGSNLLSVVASNATGYQWYLGGNPITGANSQTYTATAAGTYKVVVSGMCSSQVTSANAVLSTCPAVTINTQPLSQSFCGSVQLSVSASNATGYQWKKGGNNITGANSQTYTATSAGSYTVVVSGNCGSPVTSNAAVLTANASATINTQPLSQSFCGSVQLSVSASNASGYQWKKGNNNIIGANNSTYTATSAGSYTVVVSGNCGSPVTSNPAVLTAAPGVTINTQPQSQSFCGSVQLSVSASNASGYQWKKGGTNITGATNPTYTATTAGTYTVVVSALCGSPVTSSPAVLTANGSVAITTQPVDKSICSGGSATFSVSASNASGYQWFRGNSSIGGATSPTYTTSTAGNYKVVVSGGCGSPVTSNTVTLSVSAGVTIVTQPVSTQICAGGTESFSVVARNATGYQWYRNSNLINGATSSQYFTGTTGRYDCRVFDACGGSVMSDFAMLTINSPVAITSQPQSQAICSGGSAMFTVSASNANGYQWYRNNNGIPNATHATYTATATGNYKVVVTGGCGGPITSNTVTLSLLPPPTVAGINGTGTICAGTTVRFTDATSGGTWSSSDNSVATVSATGFVRGAGAGTATIRYTISNGCSSNTATRNITVNDVPSVQDITGSSSVCPGSTIQLSDGTPNGDWSSSNTSVATVTNNGRVRGIRNGNVTITYTVSNSCGMQSVSTPIAVSCGAIQKNSLGASTNSDDQLTLSVSVTPNPTQNFFTLITQSSVLDAPITISIFDMQNRLVDKHTAGVGEAVRFGDRFAAGMYIVQVTQGGLQKTVKVVKN